MKGCAFGKKGEYGYLYTGGKLEHMSVDTNRNPCRGISCVVTTTTTTTTMRTAETYDTHSHDCIHKLVLMIHGKEDGSECRNVVTADDLHLSEEDGQDRMEKDFDRKV